MDASRNGEIRVASARAMLPPMATATRRALLTAATAMLLVSERHARAGHRLLGGVSLSATEYSHLCIGTETQMKTDAAKLLREGVTGGDR